MATASATSSAASPPRITKETIDEFNYFVLFGLVEKDSSSVDVDAAALRRVYRRLSLCFHPDKDNSPEARHAFEVVRTALETLIDPQKREAYQKSLRGGGSRSEDGEAAEQQKRRAQQAQEDAQLAADLLLQREYETAAKEAAARLARQEREEASRRMISELTSSLDTPLKQLEEELVRDWDIDAATLAMKEGEVARLLQKLAAAHPEEHSAASAAPFHERKRVRDDAD